MDILRNQELISYKQEIFETFTPIKEAYPGLIQDPPDFSTYSHALIYSKSLFKVLSKTLENLHKTISQNRYGQEFFKISQDLAQSKSKLKTKVKTT
jgi:hypothetical protein